MKTPHDLQDGRICFCPTCLKFVKGGPATWAARLARLPAWALALVAFVLGFCAGEARISLWLGR